MTSSQGADSPGILLGRWIVLGVALLLMTRNIEGRFVGRHCWNDAMFSAFARSHLEYGLSYTKGFCTWGNTAVPPTQPNRYLNHPPLMSIFVVIPMAILGDHEWVGRIVPILFTLGSTYTLMVMIGRLQTPILGLLTGFFYATLPITAYFGRMINHEAPVQFFSLLMLHGYLQWAGVYGQGYRRANGKLCYILGVALGIASGWAAVVMAGLIWIRHASIRIYNRPFGGGRLGWLTVVPAVSLSLVLLHIVWGCNWDFSLFGPMLWRRSLGPYADQPLPWSEWGRMIWQFLLGNFTVLGIGGCVAYLVMMFWIPNRTAADSPLRQIVCNTTSVMPILLTGVQGIVWILAFKHHSYIHEYWQIYLSPFVAVAMASVVGGAFVMISRWAPRAANYATIALMLLPVPSFARAIDAYHRRLDISPFDVATLVRVSELIPAHAPAMTSTAYPEYGERLGNVLCHNPPPSIAYYAHRPLIHSTNIDEINAARSWCAAYILEGSNDPNLNRLGQELAAKYPFVDVQGHHRIFLLMQPSGQALLPH